MKSKFHQIAVGIALNAMPSEYKAKFLDGFSMELLQECADIPYVPSKFGEPEQLHLGHSYKLQLKGRDLHRIGESSTLDEIVNFAKSVPTLQADGKPVLVRYNIAKATHYLIDIGTYPHVNEATWDKYHTKYEELAADWLELHKHVIEELVQNYTPDPMRSVPNRARSIAERAYFSSMDFLPTFKRNALLTDLQMATMCCQHVYDLIDWFATFKKYI